MDCWTDCLRELITDSCGALDRLERSGGHDLRALTDLQLLRCDVLAAADLAGDAETVADACEVVEQINRGLDRVRAAEPPAAKAS